jgi:hypothetical protein
LRLFWLVDLAEIICQNQEVNWSRLIGTAVGLDIVRPLVQGVLLAHILLDVPLPEPIRNYANRDRWVDYLCKVACVYILCPSSYKGSTARITRNLVYLLKLCSNSRYKFQILKRILAYDYWDTIPLPDLLFPLYYILGPLFVFYRRLQGNQGNIDKLLNE